MTEGTCAARAGCDGSARTADGGKGGIGIECPNCGGRTDRIGEGGAFICEKGRPLMREARYRCRHCDSTVIYIEKCEPKGAGHD